jgi:hypothetical protein
VRTGLLFLAAEHALRRVIDLASRSAVHNRSFIANHYAPKASSVAAIALVLPAKNTKYADLAE